MTLHHNLARPSGSVRCVGSLRFIKSLTMPSSTCMSNFRSGSDVICLFGSRLSSAAFASSSASLLRWRSTQTNSCSALVSDNRCSAVRNVFQYAEFGVRGFTAKLSMLPFLMLLYTNSESPRKTKLVVPSSAILIACDTAMAAAEISAALFDVAEVHVYVVNGLSYVSTKTPIEHLGDFDVPLPLHAPSNEIVTFSGTCTCDALSLAFGFLGVGVDLWGGVATLLLRVVERVLGREGESCDSDAAVRLCAAVQEVSLRVPCCPLGLRALDGFRHLSSLPAHCPPLPLLLW